MTKFFSKLKKSYFRPIFRLFSQFLRQKRFSKIFCPFTHNFVRVSSPKLKFTKFQEQVQTDGRTEGRLDYFIRPFWLPREVQKQLKNTVLFKMISSLQSFLGVLHKYAKWHLGVKKNTKKQRRHLFS